MVEGGGLSHGVYHIFVLNQFLHIDQKYSWLCNYYVATKGCNFVPNRTANNRNLLIV